MTNFLERNEMKRDLCEYSIQLTLQIQKQQKIDLNQVFREHTHSSKSQSKNVEVILF